MHMSFLVRDPEIAAVVAKRLNELIAKHKGVVRNAAVEFGCERTSFYSIVRRFGADLPRMKPRAQRALELKRALIRHQWNTSAVGAELGLTAPQVRNRCHAAGIPSILELRKEHEQAVLRRETRMLRRHAVRFLGINKDRHAS